MKFVGKSNDLCPIKSNLLKLNELEKIKLPENESDFEYDNVTEFTLFVPKYLLMDTITLLKKNKIATGTFGTIYSYEHENIEVALKVFHTFDDSEISLIKTLKQKAKSCESYIVETVILEYKKYKFVLMNKLAGSLRNLVTQENRINEYELVPILYKVAKEIECLYNLDFIYNDIKPDNILYYCMDNHEYNILLADLGGIITKGEYGIGSTLSYFVPDVIFIKDKALVWQLGLLSYELLFGSSVDLYSSYIKDQGLTEYLGTIFSGTYNKIASLPNKKVANLLIDMLQWDHTKRINLTELIDRLEFIYQDSSTTEQISTHIENTLKDVKPKNPFVDIQYPAKFAKLSQDYEILQSIDEYTTLNENQIDVLKRNKIFFSDKDTLDSSKMNQIEKLISKMTPILEKVNNHLKQKIYFEDVNKDEQIQNDRYNTTIKQLENKQKNIATYIKTIQKRIEENNSDVKRNNDNIKKIDSIIESFQYGGSRYKKFYHHYKQKYLHLKKPISSVIV